MITHQDMLGPVLADPGDDAPRLVYADWLDENESGLNGLARRAEFIRVQCELTRWRRRKPCRAPIYSCYEHGDECLCPDEKTHDLYRREIDLLRAAWMDWLPSVGGGATFQCLNLTNTHPYPTWCGVTFRRGFIDRIDTTTPAFFAMASAMFDSHPITQVGLADRRPFPTLGGFLCGWSEYGGDHIDGSDVLPTVLWNLLQPVGKRRRYESPHRARLALSDACVAYGRSVANKHQAT